MKWRRYITDSIAVLESAASVWSDDKVSAAVAAITGGLRCGKPLLICGNGGSAADAMHITGELVGRFLLERKALNAICLSADPVILTAWGNDYSFDTIFARQVEAYGQNGAVLLGISTSGNSKNVVHAFRQARAMGITTIALTGEGGGALAPLADHLFAVPSHATPLIQQAHICLYHHLCQAIEQEMSDAGMERQVAFQAG